MPKRQRTKRVPTLELMGEGSWIEVRKITVQQAKELRKRTADLSEDELQDYSRDWIAEHVLAWNWVDDDGETLPLPSDDPSVLDQLTPDELAFIGRAIGGSQEARKN